MSKIPTQEKFNEDHKSPVEYGEDGTIAVGTDYSMVEAFELFKKYWEDNSGELPEDVTFNDVVLTSFGWGVHPDYANDEDNMSYRLLTPEDLSSHEAKPLFTGWVLFA